MNIKSAIGAKGETARCHTHLLSPQPPFNIGPNTMLGVGVCLCGNIISMLIGSAESSPEDSAIDASQSDGSSDDQQDDSDLDEDDDPLRGKTFDMSDGEGADDQSIPSEDDDSLDDSSPPEAPAEAEPEAKTLLPNGDSISPCLGLAIPGAC